MPKNSTPTRGQTAPTPEPEAPSADAVTNAAGDSETGTETPAVADSQAPEVPAAPEAPAKPEADADEAELTEEERAALGDAGKRALRTERLARQEAERKLAEALRANEPEPEAPAPQADPEPERGDHEAELQTRTQERDDARLEAARERVARVHRVSDDYMDLLTGDSVEELETQAQKIGQLIQDAGTRPRRDAVPSVGDQPQNPGSQTIGELIAAAEGEGNHELAKRLKARSLSAPSN